MPGPLSDELSCAVEMPGVFAGDATALLGPDRLIPTLTPMIRRMKPMTEMPQPETMPGSPWPSRRKNPGSAGSLSDSQSYRGRSAGVTSGACDCHGMGAGAGKRVALEAALAPAAPALAADAAAALLAAPGVAVLKLTRGPKLLTGAGDAGMRNGVATAGAAGVVAGAPVAAFASQSRPRARQSTDGNASVAAVFNASRSAAACAGRRASSAAIAVSTSCRTGGGTGFSGAVAEPAESVVMTSCATSGGSPVTASAKTAVAA